MKKLMMFLLLTAAGLTIKVTGHEAHKHVVDLDYGCPVCRWSSPSPGRCEAHNTELIQDGMYYCRLDLNVVSSSPGKCSRCGNVMLKMDTARPGTGSMVAMAQDTTKRTEKRTGKAVRDHELEEQMNNDPDNRDRSKPNTDTERDSLNVPEL